MTNHEIIQVVLVDDHGLVREGFESVLRRHDDFNVAASVDSGVEAVAVCGALERVDVVLLDVKMRGMDGFETLALLRAQHPTAAIVMLTSDHRDEAVRRAMEGGANGFLLKSIRSWELVQAVREVARTGKLPLASDLTARLNASPSPRLTEREMNVLKRLAGGSSNEEIAESIGISTNTVRTHLSNILNKLDATSRTEAVITALRNGIIDVE